MNKSFWEVTKDGQTFLSFNDFSEVLEFWNKLKEPGKYTIVQFSIQKTIVAFCEVKNENE